MAEASDERLLLQHGANFRAKVNSGARPLKLVVRLNHPEVIALLRQARAQE